MSKYNEKQVIDQKGKKTTYLEWEGGTEKILLLHGFPETPHIWEPIAHLLLEQGFTVIAPYLLGYEEVDKLDHVITIKELAEWLNAFVENIVENEDEKVFLVGHDFGAATSYAALAYKQHRFHNYIALAIPPLRSYLITILTHPILALRRRYILMFCLPFGIGRWLITRKNFTRLRKITVRWSEGATQSKAFFSSEDAFKHLPDLKGPLALYRGLLPSFSKFFSWTTQFRLGFARINTPTRIFVGADETTYPAAVFDGFSAQFDPAIPVSLSVVPNCGHFIPFDAPELIVQHILEMFQEYKKKEIA